MKDNPRKEIRLAAKKALAYRKRYWPKWKQDAFNEAVGIWKKEAPNPLTKPHK